MALGVRTSDPLRLDFSHVRLFQPGALERISNCLRVGRRRGLAVHVVVPGTRNAANLGIFFDHGIGAQYSEHASSIGTKNGPATRALRRSLAFPNMVSTAEGGTVFESLSLAGLFVGQLPTDARFVSRDSAQIRILVDRWIAAASATSLGIPASSDLEAICQIVLESILNVMDHSGKTEDDDITRVSSMLQLRWIAISSLKVVPEGFSGEDQSTKYLATMMESHSDNRPKGFLEIGVVDDGVGIAARQSDDPEIYLQSSVVGERRALSEALAAGGTIKLRRRDCYIDKVPGYGSERIAEALIRLQGYASIRSGRLNAFLVGNSDDKSAGFDIDENVRSYIPGVISKILIPLGQRRLPKPRRPELERLF